MVGEDVRAEAIAWPRWPAPNSAMLCWPAVRRILRICETSAVDVVADAALAELAEAGEVAADLRRVDVRAVGELLRGDRLLALLLGLREDLQVARQPRGDAEREALRHRSPVPGSAALWWRRRRSCRRTLASRRRAGRPRRRRSRRAPRRRARRPGCARGSGRSSSSSASMSTSSNGWPMRSQHGARVVAEVAARAAVEDERVIARARRSRRRRARGTSGRRRSRSARRRRSSPRCRCTARAAGRAARTPSLREALAQRPVGRDAAADRQARRGRSARSARSTRSASASTIACW